MSCTKGQRNSSGGSGTVETAISEKSVPHATNASRIFRQREVNTLHIGAIPMHKNGMPAPMYRGPYDQPPGQERNDE